MTITTETSVGSIATIHPLATRVFAQHDIDFCCGGDRSLAQACAAKELDASAVIGEIEAEVAKAGAPEIRWDERPLSELIDHILEAYHEDHRRELPRLEEMARKVLEVHGDKDPEMFNGILKTFLTIRSDIEQHLPKEEEILFPAIKAGQGPMAQAPMMVMESEHDQLGHMLRELRRLTGGYVVPEEACNTWRALWAGLEDLERALHEHIHLEINVLHPRARAGE